MIVVLSVGGSSINGKGEPETAFLKSFAKIIKKSRHRIGILTGGGSIARIYANAARKLGAGEYEADAIAIASTKQNAQLMIAALAAEEIDVYKKVLDSFEEVKSVQNRVVVMGGTIPGITTDTDAVLLAEALGAARLVNVSNVEGIYDSNPKTSKNAKKYSSMGYDELIALATSSDQRKAGTHFVFDILACKLIARSAIEAHFVGNKIKEIENAIEGKKHKGTIVK
ncbi:UMP kinase [Candidatus Micrarchaeota archaeon]|nr:UMP kinase [Candidatus Micrarchaeota archaeon]